MEYGAFARERPGQGPDEIACPRQGSQPGTVIGGERRSLVNNIANAAEAIPRVVQRRAFHIVFASTSGHTEYVVEALIDSLRSITPGWEIEQTMAEQAQPQDLLDGDVLVLASATWNTGGIEGQLNPHMWVLLHDKAKTLDLAGKPCACIGLGDHRYFYTARAADHLQHYVKAHHGRLIVPTLKIINEPYGQEEAVGVWSRQLADASKPADGC
jgi:flavodoxin I